MKETWKPIPSFPRYEVSNLGRVRSVRFKTLTKLIKQNGGYLRFKATITTDTKQYKKHFSVHRCVAEAFLGPPPSPKHQVNHINKIRTDNRLENLEWVTQSQNELHKHRFHLYKNYGKRIKDGAKLSRLDVIDLKYDIIKGLSNQELAKKYKVTQSTISKIRNGQIWTNVVI